MKTVRLTQKTKSVLFVIAIAVSLAVIQHFVSPKNSNPANISFSFNQKSAESIQKAF